MILLNQLKSNLNLAETLDALTPALTQEFVNGITRGIEKENLRVEKNGQLAQTPHPSSLGKALTNPTVTLDFSDALIEMITPPLQGYDNLNRYLLTLNRFILDHISPESLWPLSMPPEINDQLEVSIADFGQSNVAQMKHIYRLGLWHRYGRIMQAIAGIHYNISFPASLFETLQTLWNKTDFSTSQFQSYVYMKLVRNFYRYAWLLPYLFGASPVCAKTSVGAKVDYLQALDEHNMLAPFGTSLRMSDLGYHNSAQAGLSIDLNSVNAYSRSLFQATRAPSDKFKKIAVKEGEQYQQLNQNILQIENEYYSFIRPKATLVSGEPPSISLCCNGVDYIEIRLLDLNPLLPLGIDASTQEFMDAFLLFCMVTDDYTTDMNSMDVARRNFQTVCTRGREPNFQLADGTDFKAAASELLDQVQQVAGALDQQQTKPIFSAAVNEQVNKINDISLTPSAQLLAQFKTSGLSYDEFCLQLIEQSATVVKAADFDTELYQSFADDVHASLEKWEKQEALPQDFDVFLEDYMTKKHRCG